MSPTESLTRVWQLTRIPADTLPWLFHVATAELQTHTEFCFNTSYVFHCTGVVFQGTANRVRQIQETRVLVDLLLDDFQVVTVVAIPKCALPQYPAIPRRLSRQIHDEAARFGDSDTNFRIPGTSCFSLTYVGSTCGLSGLYS